MIMFRNLIPQEVDVVHKLGWVLGKINFVLEFAKEFAKVDLACHQINDVHVSRVEAFELLIILSCDVVNAQEH